MQNADILYNILQVFSIVAYSVGLLNIFFMIFIYRTVNRDSGLFWTVATMACFLVIVVGMMLFPILDSMGFDGSTFRIWLGIIDYFILVSMAAMVYVIPAFAHSMNNDKFPADKKDWRGIVSVSLMLICLIAIISQSYLFPRSSLLVTRLVTISLSVSIVYSICFGTILSVIHKKKNENLGVKGYRSVAIIMGKATFFFLPAFFLFDFFPMSGIIIPYEIQTNISAVPFFFFLWNYLLLKENLSSFSQYLHRSAPACNDEVSYQFLEEKNLSAREKEVACLLVQGKSYAEIEEALCISKATVKTHTNRIYKKTGFKNQNELIRNSLLNN